MDWRGLPLNTAAVLASGLPEESRVKRRLYGLRDYPIELLLGEIVDSLRLLLWSKTEDAMKNRNRPDSIVDFLTEPKKTEKQGFTSIEAFEEAYKRFIGN